MEALFARLLQVDFSQLPLFLVDTLKNPSQDPRAFVLVVLAITTLLALLIMVVVLVFLASPEDAAPGQGSDAARAARKAQNRRALEVDARKRVIARNRRRQLVPIIVLIWVAIVAGVWVVGGFASRPDAVCLSCHLDDSSHTARLDESTATVDPHQSVRCVSCHETPKIVWSVTTAVPGRAMHYVGGAIRPRYAAGYGIPVANRSCADCHEATIEATFTDKERGLRVSHKEPLEQGALCTTCHEPLVATGVVSRFTVGMEPCLRCHDAQKASAECSYCHTKDVGYAVQSQGVFEAKSHVENIDCSGCHSLKTCDACHGIRMPHTIAFMGAGHARPAVEDIWFNEGRMCKGCHTATRRPCARCHGGAFPAHPPSYMVKGHQNASPFVNGCDECHEYRAWVTGRNFCGNCHPKWASAIQR